MKARISIDDWIEVNGICLRYRLSDSPGPVLVLVHEMGGAIESWDEVAADLSGNFRLLRYDQRGFGLSEKTADISLPGMVADLKALLDALGLVEPVCLAGAALGASICLAFALAHPEHVDRAVVSSPAIGGVPPAARAKLESWLDLVARVGIRAVTEQMFAVTYPATFQADRARFDRHRRRWLTVDPESFIALNRMMMGFDLSPDLSRLTPPILVLGCTYDSIRPPERCAEIASHIPNATYAEVQSGHYLPIQHPKLFADQVRAFLTR